MTSWGFFSPAGQQPVRSPRSYRRPGGVLAALMAADRDKDYLLVKKAFAASPIRVDLHRVFDGAEAMDYLLGKGKFEVSESFPRPDLILLNLIMPRKGGLETLRLIKGTADLHTIPVVLLVSSELQLHEASGLRLGADSFIVKPQSFDELVKILGDLHQHYFAIVRLPEPGKIPKLRLARKQKVSPPRCGSCEPEPMDGECLRHNGSFDGRPEELKRARRAWRLNESRLDSLLALGRMSGTSAGKAVDFVLEEQVRLTGSEAGWLGFVSEDQTRITFHQRVGGRREQKGAGDQGVHFPVQSGGILADALKERKTLVVNDRSAVESEKLAFPGDGFVCRRLLVTPVFEADRVRAVAVVANKRENYDSSDVKYHTLLLENLRKIIEREEVRKRLSHMESLAAMGSSVSCLAHDMKTPLTAIGGFAGLVHKRMEGANPDRSKLKIVIHETRRLEAMLENILDFSRPIHFEKSFMEMDEVVRGSIHLLDMEAKKRDLSLRIVIDPSLPRALIDPFRIERALLNLAINAMHSSPRGETVIIHVHARRAELLLDVIDHGAGIDPEKRKDIFTPFFTTKKNGTGLGLPIVKKIVEAHNGWISIRDNPDGGLTFRVGLPDCLEQSEAEV